MPFFLSLDWNHSSVVNSDTTMISHESSSSSKLWKYDVFLSFRGQDTRNGFTGHLHAALKDGGYEVFIDEDGLKRGEEIKPELFRAIEESRISVIVFSKSYAYSRWCLDELVKIMECRENLGREVLPIFYHVDPSHVRKQEGCFAKAFQKHEDGILEEKDSKKRQAKKERIKQWRTALTQAANLSGAHLKYGHEAKLIRRIVDENIWEWHPNTNELHVARHPIGIDSRVQPIISDLSSGESNDVKMVGIWGMGGLGKTTTVKAIYNQIHHSFQFKCFLADVSDTASKYGLVYLQEQLVSNILKQTTKFQIDSVDAGISVIKQHLRHRIVLLVIDNVDKVGQLNAIVGNRDWFGPGSIIIMTTRDEHLLNQWRVNMRYPVRLMNEEEALELFSWHAFGNSWPNEEHHELSKKVVSYCGGLPLALEVLGSLLMGRTIVEWESELEKLKRIHEGEIIEKLRISFDGLDDTQKAIFLDISCSFLGMDKDYVTKILDGCGFSATIGISVLRERCLVTVEYGMLNMHDLVREMGKMINSEEFPTQPERWSRLGNHEVVTDVLTNESGTEEIEVLTLDLPSSKKATFSTKSFANMKNLRLLQLKNVNLTGDYKRFPKKLIWLCWHGFPFKSMPKHLLHQPKLVALDLRFSKLRRGWKNSKPLENLKILDLSSSYKLKESPDFSRLPNLEELNFQHCESLSEIHPSIGQLKRLTFVNLSYCRKLRYLPGDLYNSKSIGTLLLTYCRRFRELHECLGEMVLLRKLEAKFTAITQIPSSIIRLTNLRQLVLQGRNLTDGAIPEDLGSLISLQDLDFQRSSFRSLPILSGLSNLVSLRLDCCKNLRAIPDLPTNLESLFATCCHALETMPDFSQMSNMRELSLSDSPKVTEVPGLGSDKSLNSMTRLCMEGCTNLTAEFRNDILQGWTSCGFGGIYLNGIYDIPEWFEFVVDGNKISFDVPQHGGRNFKGLTLCFVRSGTLKECLADAIGQVSITVVNSTKHTTLTASPHWGPPYLRENYFWQGQLSNDQLKLNMKGGDKIDILLEVKAKKIGVNLVWDKPLKENMHHGWGHYLYTSEPEPHPDYLCDESRPGSSHDAYYR